MTAKEKNILATAMGINLKAILKETKTIGFSGRCWGTQGSFCRGSHVTLGQKNEMVSVFVAEEGIQILEYQKTVGTTLGKKVRAILGAKNLPLAE